MLLQVFRNGVLTPVDHAELDDNDFVPVIQNHEADQILRSALDMTVGGHDSPNETADGVEFRPKDAPQSDEAIHRSAHVRVKKTPSLFGEAAALPG